MSFGNSATADLYHGRYKSHTKRFPQSIVSAALPKMDVVNAVYKLDDLRARPGNRLGLSKKASMKDGDHPSGVVANLLRTLLKMGKLIR